MEPRDKASSASSITRRLAARAGGGDGLVPTLRRLPAYIYLADLYRGKRVLEVGCQDGTSAAYLARGGAGQVMAVDRTAAIVELARSRHRLPNLSFAVAEYGALEIDDHSVDAVVVPSGVELVRWVGFLEEVRRVLAKTGTLVLSAGSADRPDAKTGVSYHDLVARLEPLFGAVRMVGVTPFVGVALVEFSDEEDIPELELDTSLTSLGSGRDAVTEYVAVAGPTSGAARSYMIVELPTSEGITAVGDMRGVPAGDARALEERLREAEALAADALARLRDVEAAAGTAPPLRGGRVEEHELRRRLARAVEERTASETELQALRARLAQAEEEIGRVAAQAALELGEARRTAQMAVAERVARPTPAEGVGDAAALARTHIELDAQVRRGAAVEAERQQLEWRVSELTGQLAAKEQESARRRFEMAPLDVLLKAADAHQKEMATREAELAERDGFIYELEEEIAQVTAAERRAAGEAREAGERMQALEAEVRELRVRLVRAEGELLRERLAPGAQPGAQPGAAAPESDAAPPPPTAGPQAITQSGPALEAAALEARLAETQALLVDKTAAADKATARWKEAEAKTDDLWRKIGDLQKELTAAREQAVENARAQRQAAQIALTRAVDEASRKLVSVQDQLVRTEKERADLEEQRNGLRARVAELGAELETARRASSETEASRRLDEERAQRAQLEASLGARAAELERVRGELQRSSVEAAGVRSELEAAAGELAQAYAALAQTTADLDGSRSTDADLELARRDVDTARAALAAAAAASVAAQNDRDNAAAELQRVRADVASRDRMLGEELGRLRADLARARAEAAGLERTLGDAERRRAGDGELVGGRLGELDEVIGTLEDELRGEEERLAGLEGRLRALQLPEAGPVLADDPRIGERDERIRVLSEELGTRDAELAIVHGKLEPAKRKVVELLSLIRQAREHMLGRSSVEVAALLDKLVADAVRVTGAAPPPGGQP
jgi:SAM-dependent methyltransferase